VGEEDGVIPVSGSGIETNSRSSGIGGNRKDFRGIPFNPAITGIPESEGIPRNSGIETSSRNSGIGGTRSISSGSLMLRVDRVPGIGWNRFRCGTDSGNVQHCGIGCIL
jgi:hypothetical protein